MSIQILLACYNGEKYLHEQIESLLAQNEPDIEILARNDGSQDQTQEILNDYARLFPDKFKVLPSQERLGVIQNFNLLLMNSTADYILFSDQDDIWLKDKAKLTVKTLQEAEKLYGKTTPLLAHTDLKVANSSGHVIHPSFWNFSRIDPFKGKALNRLLVQNTVTGCAMGINRTLASLAGPIPKQVYMHDWWIALVATLTGHILPIKEAALLYRQHENNTIGAKRPSLKNRLKKAFHFITNPEYSNGLMESLEAQARALQKRCQGHCTPQDAHILDTFLSSSQMTPLQRKWAYLRYRFFRTRILPYLFQDRPF